MKIVTVYGTRPELIKLSEVIKKLDQSFEHILIDTGQNSDFHLNKIFLKDLKIRKPDLANTFYGFRCSRSAKQSPQHK